jgi:hypothetical protein
MKKLLLLLTLLLSTASFSQVANSNYEILKLGNKYSKELIQKAFSSANLCGSHLFSKNNDIVFDDGLIVRLFPKSNLKILNYNNDCFVSDSTDFSYISWSITSSATIVKGYQVRPNKAYTK